MGKIRILYTIPNFDTAGSGKVVYDLAKNLDKEIFDIEIACNHNKGKFYKMVADLGLKIHLIDTTTKYKPLATLPFRLYRTIKFFRKNRYDIIHSWHWSSDWTEVLAARIAGIKWIYTKKAMSWGSARNWKIRSKLASFITILNPDMKERYFKKYKNVRLLPLGLDTKYYSFQEKTQRLDNLSFSEDEFIVISVVNLTKAKGLEILVDAIKILNDNAVRLLIVGDYFSEYGMSVHKMVEENKLTNSIIFTGKVLDVRPYLALSDVFVTSTNVDWEGMPMAPVEAMSSGRIVIGTDTAGINYILKGFEEYLVPPSDAEAIAKKISEVKAMPINVRLEKAQAIRDKVCREYSIEKFCTNYQNLYKELCS